MHGLENCLISLTNLSLIYSLDKFSIKQFKIKENLTVPIMADKKGSELANISVYLNTGIIAGIFSIGFIAAAVLFGVLTLILKLSG